ncbi:MAG: M16 family metallopeptidase [Phycisphaerae bacterium]
MNLQPKVHVLFYVACLFLTYARAAALDAEPLYHQLDNGLKIVLIEDPALPLVSVQLWFSTGANADPPSMPGICTISRTLFEHHDDAVARVESAGMIHESATFEDACFFHAIGPRGAAEFLLQIQRSRLAAVNVPDEAVRTAIAVASRETGSAGSEFLSTAAQSTLRAALFPDHGYARIPAHVAESAAAAPLAQIREFADKWFVPANAKLVIYGDIRAIPLREMCKELFQELPWRAPPDLYIERPKRPDNGTTLTSCGTPANVLAWRTDAFGSFDNAVVAVLGEYLLNPIDGVVSSRLPDAAASCSWVQKSFRLGGFAYIHCPVPAESTAKAHASAQQDAVARIVREELTRIANNPPDLIRLARALSLSESRHRERMSRFSRRALAYGYSEAVAGDALVAEFEREAIRGVRALEMQGAARSLLAEPMFIQQISRQTVPANLTSRNATQTDVVDERGGALRADLPRYTAFQKLESAPVLWQWRSNSPQSSVTLLRIETEDVALVCSADFSESDIAAFSAYCSFNGITLQFEPDAKSLLLTCDADRWQSALERLWAFMKVEPVNHAPIDAEPSMKPPVSDYEIRLTIAGPVPAKALEAFLQERIEEVPASSGSGESAANVLRALATKKTLSKRIQGNVAQSPSGADGESSQPVSSQKLNVERIRLWVELQSSAQMARHLHQGLVLPWEADLVLMMDDEGALIPAP